jgi:Cu(I)/Ag(I) efflux system membrane fusion protein
MHPQIVRNEPGIAHLRNDFSPKVTDKQAVESHSIEHLLRPTDSFVVGNYTSTSPIDTTFSSTINLPGLVAYDPIHQSILRQGVVEENVCEL